MNLNDESEASVNCITEASAVLERNGLSQSIHINRLFRIKMAIGGAMIIAVLTAALLLNDFTSRASPIPEPKTEKELIQAWEQHILDVKSMDTCGEPLPRLIRVSEEFSDAGKWYVPSCALLHRCELGVGCCQDENADCGPEKTEQVWIPIQTIEVESGEIKIEQLEFTNHTKCGCVTT